MYALSLLLALALLPMACQPPEFNQKKEIEAGQVNLDLRNKQVQKLYDLRDRQKTDSLILYLNSGNVTLRYLAALAFASVRDTNAIQPLIPLLHDPSEEVRIAAAFSLGQIGSIRAEKALIEAFESKDSLSLHQRFNAIVLEAVGKCGSKKTLRNIASVTTYQPTDTLLLEGQCRAVLRFTLRDSTDPVATQRMVEYVGNERIPIPARLAAAYSLARAKDIKIDSVQATILALGFVRAFSAPELRSQIAIALGKSATRPAFAMLSKVLGNEKDWRVQTEIIRAFGQFDYDTTRVLVAEKLSSPNPLVSLSAAEFFVENGKPKDGEWYWRMARDNPDWPVMTKIALYRAANKNLSYRSDSTAKADLNWRLKQIFQQSKNPYERAACLRALIEHGWNYSWVRQNGFNDPAPAVRMAAAEAMVTTMKRPDFWSHFGESGKGVRRALYNYAREIIASADPSMIVTIGPAFDKNNPMNYKDLRDSTRLSDFRETFSKLQLPRDYEAVHALEKAIAYLEGRPEPSQPLLSFNHPIDWERLQVVSQQTEVTVQTAKGNIVLEFWPQWAPNTVASFLELAATGYYNGKAFHRVVPNHVIQGGCPRGDGSGGLDYSLRSEIGMAWYDRPGLLGMASDGPNTESVQFFITHAARAHLDGKYTIFGRVKSGMDVVNQIMPGDLIEKMTLKY